MILDFGSFIFAVLGSSAVGVIVTWLFNRRKLRAEAHLTEEQADLTRAEGSQTVVNTAIEMCKVLTEQVRELRQENADARERISGLETQVRDLEHRCETLEAENQQLRSGG